MCARPLPTGAVTFLFTDIASSTRLLQLLGPDYARALGESQELLRAAFTAHNGAEVDTQGDAFFAAFPTASAAMAAAAEGTQALASHIWPEDAALRVRMGLHTGAPQLVGDQTRCWIRASCSSARRPVSRASACWASSTSTPWSGWRRVEKPRRCAGRTPSTTSRSPSELSHN